MCFLNARIISFICFIWIFSSVGVAIAAPDSSKKNSESKILPVADETNGAINIEKKTKTPAGNSAVVSSLRRSSKSLPRLNFYTAATRLWLECTGMLGLLTYTGFRDWKWGTASFRFNSEGWFGMDTGSGGMDKLGHLYGGYAISELLYWRLRYYYGDTSDMTVFPAVFSLALMLYVEVFDGFSVDHGWSWEDVAMDAIGAGLSFLRYVSPRVAGMVDFRYEYFPSKGQKGFHPIIDYAGQKYLLVFKFAGVERLQSTPLAYFEIMLGYYTRGFLKHEADRDEKKANLFFGVGLSLEELLFKPLEKKFKYQSNVLTTVSHYFQVPYTYLPVTLSERRRSR